MSEQSETQAVVGIPEEFTIDASKAVALDIDALLEGVSLEHGTFLVSQALGTAAKASESSDPLGSKALYLLTAVTGLTISDDPRRQYEYAMAGTFGGGQPWRTMLPSDLSQSHLDVLVTVFSVVTTPVLRARFGDVLWNRVRPRNPQYAREAIAAYLAVAETTFDPDNWVISHQQLSRAFVLMRTLGRQPQDQVSVVGVAQAFLERLAGQERSLYSQRLIDPLMAEVSDPAELMKMLTIAEGIIRETVASRDFHRARAYYDVSIPLASRLGYDAVTLQGLRIARAETYVIEAAASSTEMQRAMNLRIAVQELRQAGAPAVRRAEVAQLLDEAQTVSINEMTTVSTPLPETDLADRVREHLQGRKPFEAFWLFAGIAPLPSFQSARQSAEESLKKHVFAFGFAQTQYSRDGRREGETPGFVGADDATYELAIQGAMRRNASYARIMAAFGYIEPGRQQLLLDHEYSLDEVRIALQARPFIPRGHLGLWSKGIHAGLLGEYDVAVHLLAPQLEHALREVLSRHGEITYSMSTSGVQSLLSVEKVLEHPTMTAILGEDLVFALDTVLAERLGANLRNTVAHGIIDDGSAGSHDAAYLWWLALYLLRAYGSDALATIQKDEA